MKKCGILTVAAVCIGCLLSVTSCKLPSVKKLEEENARLQEDIVKSDSIQIQFMNAYAEIEANLNEIKLREKMINENSLDAEENTDIQQKIINDIVEIGKLMETNRQKLQGMEKLRKQLISSRSANKKLKEENAALKEGIVPVAPAPVQEVRETAPVKDPMDQKKIADLTKENSRLAELNKTLEETVSRLKQQLAESEARVESLQEELALLKEAYAALQKVNDSLRANAATFQAQLSTKDRQIDALNDQLAAAAAVYYAVGNAKDLKAKNITLKKSINPDASLKSFTRVNDMSELREIPFNSKQGTLITVHPEKSYEIDKSDPKNWKLKIKNPKAFWGTSRVCVIEVK